MSSLEEKVEKNSTDIAELTALIKTLVSASTAAPVTEESANTTRTTATRSLLFPTISTPVTASRYTSAIPATKQAVTTLPPLEQMDSSFMEPELESEEKKRQSILSSLQKGMAKPPFFEGNTGEKGESISVWWKQVGNFAKTYNVDVQHIVIKSYLRGSAALWLDSREREIGRELTVQELADGLTVEYGSEMTSFNALVKLDTLSMAFGAFSTLSSYNSEFHKWYNQVAVQDQAIAIRNYVKGIHPSYLKHWDFSVKLSTLGDAKTEATKAVAKHDMLQLSYQNYELQKNRAISNRTANNGPQPTKPTPSISYTGRVNLNVIEEGKSSADSGETGEAEGVEGRVAVVGVSSPPQNNSKSQRFPLTDEQLEMLRSENRCFKCHKVGHRSRVCRSAAAKSPPVPLNSSAPSRK